MPVDLASPPAFTSHFRTAGQPEILNAILEVGINLCIWERSHDQTWSQVIQAILSHRDALALDLTAPNAKQIEDSIAAHVQPKEETLSSAQALAADISTLSARFAAIAGIRHPRVRLTRVEDDGCALFHADTLSLRLLCTYAGPGTQWLQNDNLRRDELGSRGRSLKEATDAIVVDPLKIRTLSRSHVAIFQGRLMQGEEDNALVHRSSPVRHSSDFRIRLCIDLPTSCTC